MSVTRLIPAILALLASVSCSDAPQQQAADPAGGARGAAGVARLTLSVLAVDADKRLITLKSPEGATAQYTVGKEVKRLAEIHAGDTIVAEYKVAASAELREPTAEEKASPLVLVQGADRAPAQMPPGAAFARIVRAVTTVVSIDAKAKTFTVKGPLQGMVDVALGDSDAHRSLKVGQTIVVTFAESFLLSVEPGAKDR